MIFLNSSAKKILLLLLISFSFANISQAQKVRIKKILDSNLFELTDGRLIKLAGIDVPNINHKSTNLQQVGVNAYSFAKHNLLKKKFELTFPNNIIQGTDYILVYIRKEYPILTKDFTKEYLEKGFGKLISNTDYFENAYYTKAEKEAKEGKEGIWEFKNDYMYDTLDQTFRGSNLLTDKAIDSIKLYPFSLPFVKDASVTERILIELVAAPLVGTTIGFCSMAATAGVGYLIGGSGLGNAYLGIVGGYVGYALGTAMGVHYIAKNTEKDVTLAGTFAWSAIGALTSYAIIINSDNFWGNDIYNYTPLILPGIASIIYANFIAPLKDGKQYASKSNINDLNLANKNFTHQEYYNSTKIIEMNLFRINF
ncbi:MAG: thermonuclease family protein [Melioribacteraceae bacterium]